jgi:VanZ like family
MIKLVQRLCQNWHFPLLWTFIILALLVLPGAAIPGNGLFGIKNIDKVAHIILFGGFVLFWAIFSWNRKKSEMGWVLSLVIITLISIAIGVIMEFVQRNFIPNRSFDIGDIWADLAGSAVVAILLLLSGRKTGVLL